MKSELINYDKIEDLKIIIRLNHQEFETFYPACITIHGMVVCEDGKNRKPYSLNLFLGNGKSTKYTNKELHNAVKNKNDLHTILANKLKEFATNTISDDL